MTLSTALSSQFPPDMPVAYPPSIEPRTLYVETACTWLVPSYFSIAPLKVPLAS